MDDKVEIRHYADHHVAAGLRRTIRDFAKSFSDGRLGSLDARDYMAQIRVFLGVQGLSANCHTGLGRPLQGEEIVQWYAGHLLAMWQDGELGLPLYHTTQAVEKFCPPWPETASDSAAFAKTELEKIPRST